MVNYPRCFRGHHIIRIRANDSVSRMTSVHQSVHKHSIKIGSWRFQTKNTCGCSMSVGTARPKKPHIIYYRGTRSRTVFPSFFVCLLQSLVKSCLVQFFASRSALTLSPPSYYPSFYHNAVKCGLLCLVALYTSF